MTWQEIRQAFPSTWLLVEALEATTQAGMREVEDFAVLGRYDDSSAAMGAYTRLHHVERHRELYVIHTSRVTPEIHDRVWLGVRPAR